MLLMCKSCGIRPRFTGEEECGKCCLRSLNARRAECGSDREVPLNLHDRESVKVPADAGVAFFSWFESKRRVPIERAD